MYPLQPVSGELYTISACVSRSAGSAEVTRMSTAIVIRYPQGHPVVPHDRRVLFFGLTPGKEFRMPTSPSTLPIVRRSTPVMLCLDADALQLLRAMQTNSKSYGLIL